VLDGFDVVANNIAAVAAAVQMLNESTDDYAKMPAHHPATRGGGLEDRFEHGGT
jgi:hypothetical protein